jgi:hypothetical protein
MLPFIKVLRVADSGKSNLVYLYTGYFNVVELFSLWGDDAASALEMKTTIFPYKKNYMGEIPCI